MVEGQTAGEDVLMPERTDTERLDWLEVHLALGWEIDHDPNEEEPWAVLGCQGLGDPYCPGPDFRAAIDKAMEQGQDG